MAGKRNIAIVNGKVITPIFTEAEANGKAFVHGEDKQGPYVAYRLDNQKRSDYFSWYILISPEDLQFLKKYNWCLKKSKKDVLVRTVQTIQGKQKTFLLNRVIWERMTSNELSPEQFVYRRGHPLDFRRTNFSLFQSRLGLKGVTWHKGRLQVQITFKGNTVYVGRALYLDDGYRMYNLFLRDLKQKNPEDGCIQSMLYNQIEPMF